MTADLRVLPNGHRNRVVRTVGLKTNLVFKTTRRSEDAIAWLGPVLACAAQSGFVVPCMHRSLRGTYVIEGWTCETLLNGVAPKRVPVDPVLQRIKQFHCLSQDTLQRPGFLSVSDLLIENVGGDVDLTCMPTDLVKTCRDAWRCLPKGPPAVVHGDLNASNLLVGDTGAIGLVDWDECRLDHPEFDLAQFRSDPKPVHRALRAYEVACSWTIEPNHARKIAASL